MPPPVIDEGRLVEWFVQQGLLCYYPHCTRPDKTHGPAWVLRTPAMVSGDSCEVWHATSALGALRDFFKA